MDMLIGFLVAIVIELGLSASTPKPETYVPPQEVHAVAPAVVAAEDIQQP